MNLSKGIEATLSIRSGQRFRNKLGRLFYDFEGKNLSGFGGLASIYTFMSKVSFEEAFSTLDLGYKPSIYPVPRIMSCLALGMVTGYAKLRETARLGRDSSLRAMLGWKEFPVQSTLSRSLNHFTESRVKKLVEISAGLLEKFRQGWKNYEVMHLDLDSHVRTVYGTDIEEAKRGYNPNKRGRRSYHPLLAFIGETRDFLRGRLRAGNTVSATGATNFLQECLDQIGLERLQKLVVRADSGFCIQEFLHALEEHVDKVIYVLAMRLNSVHQRRFAGLTYSAVEGSEPEDGLEIAEYQSNDWPDKKTRRVIVVRQAIPEDEPQEVCGKQLKLFELKGYTWRAFVTSSEASPEAVWRDYNQRATCEHHIGEAIEFGLDWTASQRFWPNAAHFQLVMLSYNVFNWYKEIGFGQDENRNGVRFLRSCIIQIPVIVKYGARQIRLSFPRDWPWRKEFEKSLARIEAWKLVPT